MTSASAWRTGVATDPGHHRANNEDRVFVDEAAGVFLVVDGVGGHAAGEMAAETAVRVIAGRLTNGRTGRLEHRVRESITAANNEIHELAQGNEEWRGMACVLTLALAEDHRIVVGHVGDSRLYLMWDGKLRKITSDHSPVGEREDQGEIGEREAMAHPRRNQVFRDVGSMPRDPDEENFIEIQSFQFRPDAAFLLCSDGLTDAVPSAEIAAIIETYDGDAELVSRRLVEAANRAGGKDNISVVFVAGAEFEGAGSAAARRRHAITRPRVNRWRAAGGRALWLLGGMLLGGILTAAVLWHAGCGVWIGGGSSPGLAGNRITRSGMAEGARRAGIEIHPPAAPTLERNIIVGNGLSNLGEEIRRANITAESKP